jgi:hypothetical protein
MRVRAPSWWLQGAALLAFIWLRAADTADSPRLGLHQRLGKPHVLPGDPAQPFKVVTVSGSYEYAGNASAVVFMFNPADPFQRAM